MRAHPRSRGENKDGAGAALIRWGSSPLTRGKHLLISQTDFGARLIPAHAGKTTQMCMASVQSSLTGSLPKEGNRINERNHFAR